MAQKPKITLGDTLNVLNVMFGSSDTRLIPQMLDQLFMFYPNVQRERIELVLKGRQNEVLSPRMYVEINNTARQYGVSITYCENIVQGETQWSELHCINSPDDQELVRRAREYRDAGWDVSILSNDLLRDYDDFDKIPPFCAKTYDGIREVYYKDYVVPSNLMRDCFEKDLAGVKLLRMHVARNGVVNVVFHRIVGDTSTPMDIC